MTQSFPSPPIKLFERLQVTDGLLMNADRWRLAHEYHRQRQNVHYQSLNQPGIVCGLGVRLMPAPADVPANYRDGRWLEIQPGIAIDLVGNPIIVPQAETYHIAAETSATEAVMIYLVVSYVDPDKLRRKETTEVVKETFRIDERLNPPGDMEVELCRILLQPGPVQLEPPKDVFFPKENQLDLRFRQQARSRPEAVVRVAQVTHRDATYARSFDQLASLLQSLSGLYPTMQGASKVGQISLSDSLEAEISAYDLLFLTGQESLSFNQQEFTALKNYLEMGGVLLVDAHINTPALIESTLNLAQQLGTPLEDLKRLNRQHPLRTKPFLFSALPTINQQSIHLGYGGGIILTVGHLSTAWGLDERLSLSRETIRAAQELGINILHFASQRRQLTNLLKSTMTSAPTPSTQSRSKSIKASIYDKL
jgi:hypothetical protein